MRRPPGAVYVLIAGHPAIDRPAQQVSRRKLRVLSSKPERIKAPEAIKKSSVAAKSRNAV
jgi:hypothetical protein